MGKKQQEELRRLEEALMEEFDLEGFDSYHDKQMTRKWQSVSLPDAGRGNTDRTDVDMETYSEEVYKGHSRGGLSIGITMLSMAALSACILILFKILGVL